MFNPYIGISGLREITLDTLPMIRVVESKTD
jgi:hypothetical protein